MKMSIVGMLAETFVHPGTGQNVGAIDLPVAREAATGYPFITGSSLKGALLDDYREHDSEGAERIFGKQDSAGNLLVSDARLLLLPVRSLSSAYRWVTCPHILERLRRDLKRGRREAAFEVPRVENKSALGHPGNGRLFLEERSFDVQGNVPEDVIGAVSSLIPHEETRGRLAGQLTILSDDDFSWFARYGLAVQARNVLDPKTKKTKQGGLWYEETLPPDTLMYAVLAERNGGGDIERVREKIGTHLQVGGNETVGQGWFALGWEA
ncbi:CRISPR-associated protein, Cmr4 family [Rubrobacter xylanophilus DSM 9941]|uniref:CRISPR-associated protein, Cmr4 family n=2 Tax=Rubrobacter xylanophilus TaxID=49319 RepID=Q1AZE0_RUBXD|nr:CRISPR-associated protein, Cmr4 family [Rubrobacter xylanophilus DSM 9941]